MSIMSNKVTRRVALGTLVGGLAGAAIVIRALNRRPSMQMPKATDGVNKEQLARFVAEWERCLKMVDVPIRKIDGPSTFTLDFRPKVGMHFRAVCLTAEYGEYTYPAQYPQPPFWFTVGDGQISSVSPIVANRPALLIDPKPRITNSRFSPEKWPADKYIFVPGIVCSIIIRRIMEPPRKCRIQE